MTAALERNTLLNQILAVRASVKNDVSDKITKFHRLLSLKDPINGVVRTYKPKNDDDFRYPPEGNNVQVKASVVLQDVAAELTRLFDVTACMDWSNQHAKADIVLLGDEPVTLLHDVPVHYMLFLEKQLVGIETLVRKLPVLPPTETWTYDPNSAVHRSDPIGTMKTQKIRKAHVLYPATDKHQAQVESYTEDEPIGTWTTVKLSGALPAERIAQLLNRVITLNQAVKFAREQANLQAVTDPKPGRRIMEYLFAE